MRYMTVALDVQPEGLNVACWMSTVEFWMSEKVQYPYDYTYMGDRCTWLIHANTELTMKMVAMVGETADKICSDTERVNARRKLANR